MQIAASSILVSLKYIFRQQKFDHQNQLFLSTALQGAEARHSSPTQYGSFIQSEITRWGQIIRLNSVKMD
jgi:hypothetical protein